MVLEENWLKLEGVLSNCKLELVCQLDGVSKCDFFVIQKNPANRLFALEKHILII